MSLLDAGFVVVAGGGRGAEGRGGDKRHAIGAT
jgi:hypothetical protein